MPRVSSISAPLSAALFGFCALQAGTLRAQDQTPPIQVATEAEQPLEEVVIIGSLLPRARAETAVTTTTINAADLQARGYTTVAAALQQSAFSNGSVQGAQFTGNFTPGAQTLSMFGLSPSYVKYLVDGRPMSDYPGLYNGTDMVTDVGGIPEAFLDHIDILPGGQSSLYGSDAIAGVVNVVLIKKLDAPLLVARYGFYGDGGGSDRRIALADSFSAGSLQVIAGVQYDNANPIWGYQRDLTSSYFAGGAGPAVAERDYALADSSGNYYFVDPSHCANVANLYFHSIAEQTRAGFGNYCGTTRSGFNTIANGHESWQGYAHATDDLSPTVQLYGDVLMNHQKLQYSQGLPYWLTSIQYGYYYDPNITQDDVVNFQRGFSPEEIGGLSNTLNTDTTNSYRFTVGAQGALGGSNWSYDLGFSRTEYKLIEEVHALWTDQVNNFFSSIMGPDLGLDPLYDYYPTFEPNYPQFYKPITQAQFASFSGIATSHSETSDNMLRGQLTNPALFSLPGGNAGIALAAEGGDQGWTYAPDPRYLTGQVYSYTPVEGDGHRSRYALTAEMRLPVLRPLTLTASGRYDNYHVAGDTFSQATYNLGLEYRPWSKLLLRGRYGTAFKAPTLSDEFQGPSGYYQQVTDYYGCYLLHYTGSNIANCPNAGIYVPATTSGNTHLKPINAKVWDLGTVYTPMSQLSVNVDYLHWDISNEVNAQDPNQLLITENQCRQNILDINSPTCVAALSQVSRDASDNLLSISTPKINISNETLAAFVVGAHYLATIGAYGSLEFQFSWNDILKHTNQVYPGDPTRDALRDPTWSTDFKSKTNLAVTWNISKWSSTLYAEHYGSTPNYLATLYGYGTPGAGTVSPWTTANISTRYQWTPNLQVSLNVLNFLNATPPDDRSYPGTTSTPYNYLNYNVYGRAYFMGLEYRVRK